MAIYLTGDIHGDFSGLYPEVFPELEGLGRDDFVILCGDFGGVWRRDEDRRLDLLEKLPYTLLFVDGNHENFDLLKEYPVSEWHGGRVHTIRPNVLHLMRGQVFELDGSRFFTMGGASSHDAPGGIFSSLEDTLRAVDEAGGIGNMQPFRIKHQDWWKEELPSPEEYAEARANLDRAGWKVDYIVTHCAPTSLQDRLTKGAYPRDALTGFLEEVWDRCEFRHWFFGHYHADKLIGERFVLLYRQMVRLPGAGEALVPMAKREPLELENGSPCPYAGVCEGEIDREKCPAGPENPFCEAQGGLLICRKSKTLLSCLEEKTGTVTIPEGIEHIGTEAFCGSNLTGVELPAGLTSIGWGAFQDCRKLEAVTIPEGVEEVPEYAFAGCHSLARVSLPKGLKWIGEGAFQECRRLNVFHIDAESLEMIGNRAFSECFCLEDFGPSDFKKGTLIAADAFEDVFIVSERFGGPVEDGYCVVGEGADGDGGE